MESRKFRRIHLAAATAVMSVCPSRDGVSDGSHPANLAADAMERAYVAVARDDGSNTRIPNRIRNKLAYALESTTVRLEVWHRDTEPPLERWEIGADIEEFRPSEIGWQDQLHITVSHDFALLPGPGRFLAKPATANDPLSDPVANRIRTRGRTFVFPMAATIRLNNEGDKPVRPYAQPDAAY